MSFGFSMQCTSGGLSNAKKLVTDIACNHEPGRWYHAQWVPTYEPVLETVLAISYLASGLALTHGTGTASGGARSTTFTSSTRLVSGGCPTR